jgi:hypothetical protein
MASTIYGYTSSVSNQKPRAIAKVFVKKAADTGYSSLGILRNGKAHLKSAQLVDSNKRSRTFSAIAEYDFEMEQCSLTEIELLDTLVAGDVSVIIQCVDGQQYEHIAAATLLGLKYKIVSNAKIDANRFIQIQARVGLIDSEIDSVVPASPTAITEPVSGDTFWAISNVSAAVDNLGRPENIRPAGFNTVEICALSESSYDDMGEVTNSSIEVETFGEPSDKLRYRNVGAMIKGSFETLQDSSAEKSNLDLIHTNGANLKITQFDSLLWTLTNKVGITWDEGFDADFDGTKTIKYTFDGAILVSALDGIVS